MTVVDLSYCDATRWVWENDAILDGWEEEEEDREWPPRVAPLLLSNDSERSVSIESVHYRTVRK